MSEPLKCDDTSNNSIPNTLPGSQISVQGESDKSGKKKQKRQNKTEDDVVERFQPLDMKSLTFKPTGSEQEVSIWLATAEEFHAFVSQHVSTFSHVNVNIWPLSDRLTLINVMWEFCELRGHPFPFTIRQYLVPNVAGGTVPDVIDNSSGLASQAN